jgi:hypothetical protein
MSSDDSATLSFVRGALPSAAHHSAAPAVACRDKALECPFVSKHAATLQLLGRADPATGGAVELAAAVGGALHFASLSTAAQDEGADTVVPTMARAAGLPASLPWLHDDRRIAGLSNPGAALARQPAGTPAALPTAELLQRSALWAVDDAGAVAKLCVADAAGTPKRRRTEEAQPHGADDVALSWEAVTAAPAGVRSAFGGGGWWGVAPSAADGGKLLLAHETSKRVQLVDAAAQRVAAAFHPMHMPTALAVTSGGQALDSGFLLAEGRIVSLWDTRTAGSGAAMSMLTALSDVADVVHPHSLGCTGVGSHIVITAGTDRALTVYDLRKWSKQFVAQNVLKFSLNSVAMVSAQQGAAAVDARKGKHPKTEYGVFVAAGIDTEARVVDTATHAFGAPSAAASPTTADGPTMGPFRARIATAVHCDAGWHGAWASAPWHGLAAGLSTHGEVVANVRHVTQ